MPNDTESIPLAAHRKALREAYVKGAVRGFTSDDWAKPVMQRAEAEALARWPDPEPELRWVQADDTPGTEVALKDGAIVRRWADGRSVRPWLYLSKSDVDLVRSLLPREPVAVTDETVRKAYDTWYNAPAGSEAFRLVAEAVAADLAGPVGEKPKAQWWGVVIERAGGRLPDVYPTRVLAERAALSFPGSRVVGLAEVADT